MLRTARAAQATVLHSLYFTFQTFSRRKSGSGLLAAVRRRCSSCLRCRPGARAAGGCLGHVPICPDSVESPNVEMALSTQSGFCPFLLGCRVSHCVTLAKGRDHCLLRKHPTSQAHVIDEEARQEPPLLYFCVRNPNNIPYILTQDAQGNWQAVVHSAWNTSTSEKDGGSPFHIR